MCILIARNYSVTRAYGGIGRRASLRSWWGNPWGFKSLYAHRNGIHRRKGPTLEVTIQTLSGVEQEAEIQVSGQELQPHFDKAYERYRKKADIKGFRKGKAPLDFIKRMYGEAIEYESLDSAADAFYRKAMEEKNIQPIGIPKLVDMDFRRGEHFRFKIKYEVRPNVPLKKYKGITAEKPVHKLSDEEVQAEIEHLRRVNSTMTEVQAVTDDEHVVTADVQELDEAGTPLIGRKSPGARFLLSDQTLAPEIRTALAKAEVGATYRVDLVNDHGDHKHTIHASILVTKIEQVTLPPFDDELAKKVSQDKIVSAAELTQSITSDLERYWQDQSEKKLRDAIADELVRTHEFDVPDTLVTTFLDAFVDDIKNRSRERSLPKGFDEKKFREESRTHAIWQVKWMLLKEAIADQENLTVTETDVEQLATTEAGRTGLDKDRLLEYYKSSGAAADRLLTEKVMAFLKEHATVKEVEDRT